MKTSLRRSRTLALSALAFLLALPVSVPAEPNAPAPETPGDFLRRMQPQLDRDDAISKITAELNTIVLPKIEFRNTTVRDAVDHLNTFIQDHNAKAGGLQIPPLRIRAEPMPGAQADSGPSPSVPGLPQAGPDNSPAAASVITPTEAQITLSLLRIPLPEALTDVANLTGFKIDIEPGTIWLKPIASGGGVVLEKHVYIVPATVCSTKEQMEALVGEKSNDYNPKAAAQQYWEFDEKSHLLTLQWGDSLFPEFELRYARALLKHGFKPSFPSHRVAPPPETPGAFLQRMQPQLNGNDLVSKTTEELSTIVLPKVVLHDATFQQAVDYLNTFIRDHNARPSAFQIPPLCIRPTPPKFPFPEPARITLSLSDVSFPDALREVASIEGDMADIGPDAIWLKPFSHDGPAAEVRIYIIPSDICSTKAQVDELVGESAATYNPRAINPQSWNFDEQNYLLTLQGSDNFFTVFELRYARELFKHGFRPPVAGQPVASAETPAAFLLRMQPELEREAVVWKIAEELDTIVLPNVELHNATTGQLVDCMNAVIRDHNAKRPAVQIPPLWTRPAPAPEASYRFGFGWLGPVPFSKVLRNVTKVTDTVADIEPDAIRLQPLSPGEGVIVSHSYIVPPNVCCTKTEVKELMEIESDSYDPRAITPQYWHFDEKSHLLTLRYTDGFFHAFELHYAHALLDHGFRLPGPAHPGAPQEAAPQDLRRLLPDLDRGDATSKRTAALNTITLLKLDLHAATFRPSAPPLM